MSKLLQEIQDNIDKTTMYKTVSYSLTFLVLVSLVASLLGITGFNIIEALLSLTILLTTNILFNKGISKFLNIKAHQESTIITALILYFLYTPTKNGMELVLLTTVSLISVLSKYLITKNNTHILNPAAITAVISAVLINYPATWWVGSSYMILPVILVALVVLRKQRKFIFASTFLIASLITTYFVYNTFYQSIIELIVQTLLTWPLIFFVSIMVTEPFTLPNKKHWELLYAVLIGILTVIPFHIWKIGTSPETALVICNILIFLLLPRARYLLSLKNKKEIAPNIFEFIFEPNKKVKFEAGQYMEVMVPHRNIDIRGERRYFTIVSSPNEKEIKFTIRVNEEGSSFKKELLKLKSGSMLYGQQVRGDFTLDKNPNTKYVFIAGGIGVTPFVSIITHLLYLKKPTDITLLFVSNRETDFIYKDLWKSAEKLLGIKVYYVTREELNKTFVRDNIKDYKERKIYISGPNAMVQTYTKLLNYLGVSKLSIKTDYFNGF